MEPTHLDMADAVADVAIGAYACARWSDGYRRVGQVERARGGGVVVSTFTVDGQRIAAHAMSDREVDSYLAHARRSAA